MNPTLERAEPRPLTRASAIAYVMFARPSIERASRFLRDFGMGRLSHDGEQAYFGSAARGEVFYVVRRDPKPRFLGLAMYVTSEQDLHALCKAGLASRIEPLAAPNGERYVRMTDPNGFEVHAVVASATDPNGTNVDLPTSANSGWRTPRVDTPFSSGAGVPPIMRLGHVVMETTDFLDTVGWYQRVFGLIVSDYQHLDDGTPIVAFCRCDRGDTPTDHHTIAIGQTFRIGFEHVAFEVADIEAVTRGQHVLRQRGWKHSWGVGRHIMGSQVFDYWYDDYGAKHEHYADGDAVTASFPMGSSPFGPAYLAQWGPTMPSNFIGGRPTPKVVVDLVRFAASRRLPLRRLAALIKAAKFSDGSAGVAAQEGRSRDAAR